MSDVITVLQLTDLHLFADETGRFNGVNTRACFLEVLAHVRQHYNQPDVVVLTGDLAHDGHPDTYLLIAELLSVLNAPVYFVLGNHDHREHAYAVYPYGVIQTQQDVALGAWHIILLDSNHNARANCYEGQVSRLELDRLATLASGQPNKHILIAMHHNLPCHTDRGVAYEVRNHQEVITRFEQWPHIRVVISGHVHQEFTIVHNGICYFSTPATGYQSRSKSGQVTGEMPGYRWLKLYTNGRIETDIRRINTFIS